MLLLLLGLSSKNVRTLKKAIIRWVAPKINKVKPLRVGEWNTRCWRSPTRPLQWVWCGCERGRYGGGVEETSEPPPPTHQHT
jgi:hypothetical protein